MSAGFALTHPSSVTDITAIEAVRVEELDEAAVSCTGITGTYPLWDGCLPQAGSSGV